MDTAPSAVRFPTFRNLFSPISLLSSLTLLACSPSIDDSIEQLASGGDEREAARQELLLAKDRAVPRLLEALEDPQQAAARAELVGVLASLMMRVDDPRIEEALLVHLLSDPDPRVRARVAHNMGLQKRARSVERLLQAVSDGDGEVRFQALLALGMLEFSLSDAQKLDLAERARALVADEHEGARMEAMIQVENAVRTWIDAAREMEIKAQMAQAGSLYAEAVAYSPGSKRANYRLARFHLDGGKRAQGLSRLREHGMLMEVPRMRDVPTIDGRIDEQAWQQAGKVDSFYQFSNEHYAALPSEVRTRVYAGYVEGALYLGFHCDDDNPDSLLVGRRPGKVWWDDDVEFYCDANFDHYTYCQIGFNSAGLVNDEWFLGGLRNQVESWDAEGEAAVHVGEDFWSVEYRLSVGSDEFPQPEPGMLWGFNFVRVFRGSEYSQWTRTYGGNAHQPDDFGVILFQ